MKIVCAWCAEKMGTKEGPDDLTTHSICDECQGKMIEDNRKRLGYPKKKKKTNPGTIQHLADTLGLGAYVKDISL